MNTIDFIRLIHPILAVVLVFPLVGIVSNFAWQTRQRRLEIKAKNKSKIPALVGKEHVDIGKWLAATVIGVSLVGLAFPLMTKNILPNQLWQEKPFLFFFLVAIFVLTIVSLIFLYRARLKLWRGVFATLTGMGIVILGCQEGIFRRTNEWYWSHYYYGIIVCLLMIFSLAIIEEIYRDRSNLWRNIHIILNCFALLLFIGQGMTGTRDLFEIGLYASPPGLLIF